jgi:hypothetical protein
MVRMDQDIFVKLEFLCRFLGVIEKVTTCRQLRENIVKVVHGTFTLKSFQKTSTPPLQNFSHAETFPLKILHLKNRT